MLRNLKSRFLPTSTTYFEPGSLNVLRASGQGLKDTQGKANIVVAGEDDCDVSLQSITQEP